MSVTQAAEALHVARVTLSKVLNGNAGISAEMSLRLAKWLGASPIFGWDCNLSTTCGKRHPPQSCRKLFL
jgi:plasmid maintenance system antidote protein VapI